MSSEKHFEHAVAIARDALKALLLVNGGAATALIALTDSSKSYIDSVVLFGFGSFFAVLGYILAYFSQLNYANHRMQVEERQKATVSHKYHLRWQRAAIAAVAVSAVLMLAGLIVAARAAAN